MSYKFKTAFIFSLSLQLVVGAVSCSNRIALSGDRLMEKQTVTIKMKSGRKIAGEIREISDKEIILIDDTGQEWAADRMQISKITGPMPVLDNNNQIISEREIKEYKTKNNFWLFTISGGLLSAGCGFFLSSMISRANDEQRNPIIIGGTAAATVLGSYWFARLGLQKDRQKAINKIRLIREMDEQYISEEERKKQQIEQEIEELKKSRQQQEQEIELLRKQIREKE